jgi:hypothetical protein
LRPFRWLRTVNGAMRLFAGGPILTMRRRAASGELVEDGQQVTIGEALEMLCGGSDVYLRTAGLTEP